MSWSALQDLVHRARNVVRRGYLISVNDKGKLLRGRVKTGDAIENVDLDVVHPVGFISRIKPGPKVEVITLDVNSDASKRVILAVIGDRANHPKVGEDESVMYAPTDSKKKMTVSKSGGMKMEMDDAPINMDTKKTFKITAPDGVSLNDVIQIDKFGNVFIKGALSIEKNLTVGTSLIVGGDVQVTGTVSAADFITT